MILSVDPLYWYACRWLVAGVFAIALAHKLAAFAAFERVLRDYRILPAAVVPFTARLIVFLEASVIFGLASGFWLPSSAALACALLASYGAGIALNLARGRRDIDCGCFGPAERAGNGHSLSGWLLLRNLGLIMMTLLIFMPVGGRELMWLDLTTVAAAVAAGLVLYLAADQLIANGPALSRYVR